MLKNIAKAILPPDSAHYKLARKVARRLGLVPPAFIDARYLEWIAGAESSYWEPSHPLDYNPLITIVVPVFNVPESYLKEAVFSVTNQTYEYWELLLLNASSDERCRELTRQCEQIDTRIRVIDIKNLGIGENTNQGIDASQGEYVALLDHDDTLAPQALYEVVCRLQGERKPGFIYSDEDKLTAKSGHRYDPHLKSDWSPHLFRQVNYLNHFTVIEKKLIEKVGGYRKGFDGAQDYDFYLRLVDLDPGIVHIPKILYHWRAAESSTAADFSIKKNILTAGIRALQDHLERNHLVGKVSSLEKQPGYYKVDYGIDMTDEIAIVVLPADSANYYAQYVRRIMPSLRGEGRPIKVFTSDLRANQKFIEQHADVLVNIVESKRYKYITAVLEQTKAEHLIILDAAVAWDDTDWIYELAAFINQCSDVAVAAPLIVDKFGKKIIDAGYVGHGRTQTPLFRGYPTGAHTFFGSTVWTRSVDALSGRVMALNRDTAAQYFGNSKDSIEDITERISKDGGQLLVCPQITLEYHGDMTVSKEANPMFNPIFTNTHYEFGFPAAVHFNPSGDDNA